MTDEVVGRLHDALVEALGRRSADEPLTVAEVYERLVPYREVRGRLGVELIGDYEHALLRLLAGESALLQVESAHARAAIRHEAASDFPSVGVFRQFAGSIVAVDASQLDAGHPGGPGGVDGPGSGPAPVPSRPAEAPGNDRSQDALRERTMADDPETPAADEPKPPAADEPEPRRVDEPEPRRADDADGSADPGPGAAADRSTCRFCQRALPEDRSVHFCPYCGGDQRLRPCPRCDSVVESGWRFCVRCGHQMESD